MKTNKYLFFLPMLLLLVLGSTGCSNDNDDVDSCISGTIFLHDLEEHYVFIGGLSFPKRYSNYNYIETVVVPKDEFPLKDYQSGDAVSFTIVEVKYSLPLIQPALYTYPSPTQYLCSIEICN